MAEITKLSMKLPKLKDIEVVAVNGLEHVARHLGVDETRVREAAILSNEAIINAIEHSDVNKKDVLVEFEFSGNKLTIFVRDYGKGFNAANIKKPDIIKQSNSNRKRGWGLALMKSMSDDFNIESDKDGTRITMNLNL